MGRRGSGLYLVNKTNGMLENYSEMNGAKENFIIQDRNNNYWVGTWGNGIKRFAPDAPVHNRYVHQPESKYQDARIISLIQDDVNGYIWATTYSGLLAFKVNELGMLKPVDTSSFIPQGNQMLVEAIKDRTNNLWVPAYDRPSFLINFQENEIKEYSMPALHQRLDGNPSIVSLCK